MASGGDKAIRLWDLVEDKPKKRAALTDLNLGFGGARSMAFSADNKSLAVGCGDKTVRLYDLAQVEPQEKAVLKDHNRAVNAVAYSRDGKLLATGDDQETVLIWDVSGGRLPRARGNIRIGKAFFGVKSVSFSPNGKMVATGCGNGTVQLWDISRKTAIQKAFLKMRTTFVAPLAFSPDGKTLALSNEGFVTFLDLGGRVLRQRGTRKEHTEKVLSVTFSSDGKFLGSAGEDGRVIIWNSSSGKSLMEIQKPGKFSSIAFVPSVPDAGGSSDVSLVAGNLTGAIFIFRLGNS